MKLKLLFLFSFLFTGTFFTAIAQITVPNIDFETGTTADWTYYRGQNLTGPVWNLATCSPAPTLHTVTNTGMGYDYYGGFPVVGDGLYSLKIGKDSANYNADGASYNVHVPATGHYKLMYRYAIVFQNPGHAFSQQPRFQISVTDSASGVSLPCYSYSVVSSGYLPGFTLSPLSSIVWYVPWTNASLDLDGMSGKTVTVSFRVGGCTLSGHWGYGYLDMNSGIWGITATPCHGGIDTLIAPLGDSLYKWTDSATYTAAYGTTQTIVVASPTVATTYAVLLTPYAGYGCTDTLYYKVGPGFVSHRSHDTTVCAGANISLTAGATGPGTPFTYAWTPSTGLSCTTCDPVTATPPAGTTSYKVTVFNSSGCSTTDTIKVTATSSYSAITGLTSICIGATTTLSDATSGGSWTSSNTLVATIGSSTGLVAGLSSGISVISYGIGTCRAYTTVTVNAVPGAIGGVTGICAGATGVLSDAVSGGVWTSGNTAVATINPTTGVAAGVSAGISLITYAIGSCTAYTTLTVYAAPGPVMGTKGMCAGASAGLSDAVGGGVWTSGATTIATIGPSTGTVTGISAGIAGITYTLGFCTAITTVTVYPAPGSIAGTTSICNGATAALSDAVSGGMWTSGNTAVATIGPSTGVATGVSSGTAIITYAIGSCIIYTTVTVNPLPTVTASSYSTCSDVDTLTAGGAATYSWAPSTGLSCTTCSTTTVSPAAATTYTATGTNSYGCSDTATISLNGNRILGHITFSGPTPDTLDMKVWLIQFNTSDSSITALDSTSTCVVDSIDYYEFDGEAPGSYMVKGMLLYGNPPGGSGYVPTYSLSTPHWDTAATVTHTTGSDSLHITMVYGTVPSGPGFIGGYVYSGAGKGTSGDAPVSGMLIFLENSASHVLTHTYTDGTGAYSFSNLAYDNYLIYPEYYGYRTTDAAITISAANPVANGVDFRQFNQSKIIIPYIYANSVKPVAAAKALTVFPNPTSGELNIQWANQQTGKGAVEITDVVGRKVYSSSIDINASSGQAQIKLDGLSNGVYMITIKSDDIYYCGKLVIEK